jgi:nitroimidazol reductase NimA-like FMN-containing flavoprotein (pyridoxamine 5'-phosphate oxidase superfamily)
MEVITMPKYHMRKTEREITDQQELIEILKNGKFTTIAMSRANEPYLVTLSYGFDEKKNALYFHAATEGLKLEFIRQNPEVCGTVIEDHGYVEDECEQHYRSVVFQGKMYVLEELAEKKNGLDILLNHLEKNPEPIKKRNVQDDSKYNKVAILRLDISEMTGKKAD